MTGYGKAECELSDKKIIVEIKSLNSKNLDIYTKIPGLYREKELEIRNIINKYLLRGKVEFVMYYEITDVSKSTNINATLVKNYYHQLKAIADDLGLETSEQLLQMAIRMPDTLNTDVNEINEEDWVKIQHTIEQALQQLDAFRVQEGEYLKNDLKSRIQLIMDYKNQILPYEKARTQKVKEKINESLRTAIESQDIDRNRFEQEIIYYLEKLDITEEKVRLTNHCNYFIESIDEPESNGKKLSFVSQEIGREINTIGSKANDSDIQKIVVLMKDELEKIKEQLLNIL